MTCQAEYTLVAETPAMHAREAVSEYIGQEIRRPSKQWIEHVLNGKQEQDEVIVRTDDFVLLPDTERVNRYWRIQCNSQSPRGTWHSSPRRVLNWLSILNDRSLHTLRDLRGRHVPMLKAMLEASLSAIEARTEIPRDQVMVYVHYPPSVFQLHVHFSYPYAQFCHKDAFRIHSLGAIINNLEIDGDYYAKSTLYMPLYRNSPHYCALTAA
jgi:m7GpppX diphosphatase